MRPVFKQVNLIINGPRKQTSSTCRGGFEKWTQSIAVGDKEFVMETKAKLGAKAIGRKGMTDIEGYELKESQPVGS